MTPGKIIMIVGAVVGMLMLLIPLANSLSSGLVDTKGIKPNPRGTHTAEFVRNVRPRTSNPYLFYRILVNDKTVHKTQSFNRKKVDYREQIVWDPNGTRFFFEVASRRLYGYDVVEKRDLTEEEIAAIPLATFGDTGYYGPKKKGNPAIPFSEIRPNDSEEADTPEQGSPTNRNRSANDVRSFFDFPPE